MKKYRRYLIWYLFFCWTLGMFLVSIHPVNASSIYYVSPNGSDSNAGTIGSPFKTIHKALNMTVSGDTVYLRQGDYNTFWENVPSATTGWEIRDSGITLSGYPGETAVLNGNGRAFTSYYGILSVGHADSHYNNITIKDLTFKNSSQNAFSCYAYSTGFCADIRVTGCTFYNIAERAIMFYDEQAVTTNRFQRIRVDNCSFNKIQNNASTGECITFEGCVDLSFENNTMTEFFKQGLCISNGDENVVIKDNSFENKFYFSLKIDGASYNGKFAKNIDIYRNVFWGTADSTDSVRGLVINPEIAGNVVENVNIYNNIFNVTASAGHYSHALSFIGDASSNEIKNVNIKHNTFYTSAGATSKCIMITEYNTKISNCVIANNIFVTGGSGGQVYMDDLGKAQTNFTLRNNCYHYTGGTTLGTVYVDDASEFETGSVSDNPDVTTLGSDFSLTSVSPCKDTGYATYGVSYDYVNRERPVFDGFDIGAYEYWEYIPPEIPDVDPFIPPLPPSSYEHYGWVELLTQLFADLSAPLSLIAVFAFLVIFIYLKVS